MPTWTPRSRRRQAADLAEGTLSLPSILGGLGGSLAVRFERAGDDADLDAAIGTLRQAVDLTPAGHPNLAVGLSLMGAALQSRFERAGDDADLDEAIEASQRAAELAPPGFSELPEILSNLGSALFAGSSGPPTTRTWTPRSKPASGPRPHPARRHQPPRCPE